MESDLQIAYKFLRPDLGRVKSLRFSQPDAFNDPLEARPVWDPRSIIPNNLRPLLFLRNQARLIGKKQDRLSESRALAGTMRFYKQNPDKFLNLLQESAFRGSQKIGIACFSLGWQATPMWAHYADDHFGYCLGLDLNHEFFRDSPVNIFLKINYLKERPVIDLSSLVDDGIIKKLLGFKDKRWEYEHEIRLVRYFDHLKNSGKFDRRNLPVFVSDVPDELIKEVILGYRCERSLENELLDWARSLPNARIYRISIPDSGFNLSRTLIQ